MRSGPRFAVPALRTRSALDARPISGTCSCRASLPSIVRVRHLTVDYMRIVIAGGHGKIALRLERLLADRGHTVAGLIRNPDHANDLQASGAAPILCDLERAAVEEVVE